jgi:hypothetical protein
LSELSHDLSLVAPSPLSRENSRGVIWYSVRDRRKVQTTASPHWGLLFTTYTTRPCSGGSTLSRNPAPRPLPLSHLPVCEHPLNSPQRRDNRQRRIHGTQNVQVDFCLVSSFGTRCHMGCVLLSVEVRLYRRNQLQYVCQNRGPSLTYRHYQGHARWSGVTCIGSGNRMQFTRRLTMCVDSSLISGCEL